MLGCSGFDVEGAHPVEFLRFIERHLAAFSFLGDDVQEYGSFLSLCELEK
ncbi:MAG: hypothetical protein BWY82_02010 [Verrucomicrobia bacterium ADurb.Bin474]|nr:MAG: hypothetical protein BWY82_02010 [Verrucomicrobia bacterium ADurb.Bin474]